MKHLELYGRSDRDKKNQLHVNTHTHTHRPTGFFSFIRSFNQCSVRFFFRCKNEIICIVNKSYYWFRVHFIHNQSLRKFYSFSLDFFLLDSLIRSFYFFCFGFGLMGYFLLLLLQFCCFCDGRDQTGKTHF